MTGRVKLVTGPGTFMGSVNRRTEVKVTGSSPGTVEWI